VIAVREAGAAGLHGAYGRAVIMGKMGWVTILALGAAALADQYWNYGYYTDGALAMLRHIRHSFGW
jgi:hypothetical protein